MTKLPSKRLRLKEACDRSLVETNKVPTKPRSRLNTRIRLSLSPSIRTPKPVISTGIVSDKIAALDAEERAIPQESITDGGTIPNTPSSRYSRSVFHSKALRTFLRFCFSRNQRGTKRNDANSNVQKFNVADSM